MSESNPSIVPPRRWVRRLIRVTLSVCILLAVVAVGPWVVAQTPLRSRIVAAALGPLHGTVVVGSASFGWLSAPELRDVEVRDDAGERVLVAPRIRLEKPLFSLLMHRTNIGLIEIDNADVTLVTTADSSNWEQVLAPQLIDSGSPPKALTVAVRDAKIALRDDTGREWQAEHVSARVTQLNDPAAPLAINATADVTGASPGHVEIDGEVGLGAVAQAKINLKADRFPLALLRAVVVRFDSTARVAGQLTGQVNVAFAGGEHGTVGLDGSASIIDFAASSSRLGSDTIALARMELPCRVTRTGSVWNVETFKLTCDLGDASLQGRFDLDAGPTALFDQPGLTVSANVDLAKLCAMLPHALPLQPGTRISGGRVVADAHSSAAATGVAWEGRLSAQDLRGEADGRPILIDTPIALDFAIRNVPHALPQIDRLNCRSDFLKIDASGSAEQLTLGADIDLSLLEKRLGQFVDFGSTHPAGHGNLRVTIRRDQAGGLNVDGRGTLTDLAVTLAGPRTIQEKEIQLQLAGVATPQGPSYRVDSASLHLNSGSEGIDLALLQPLDVQHLGSAKLRLALRGQLARYRTWLASFVELPAAWQIGGNADATAQLRFSPQMIELADAQATVRDYRFAGAGLRIEEPVVTLQPTTLLWDRTAGRLELRNAELTSATAAVGLSQLTLDLGKATPTITATGNLRGDLSRLARWLPTLAPQDLRGTVSGPLNLKMDAGAISGGIDLSAANVLIGDPAAPAWSEPSVRLAVRGQYEPSSDSVQVEQVKLETPSVGLSANGRVTDSSGQCTVNLGGQIDYDLEKWQPKLRPFLGADARIDGRGPRPFHVEGPLAVAAGSTTGRLGRLKVEASIGWQTIEAYGFAVGPADMQIRLYGDGWVRVQPMEASLNQGKLKLEPYVRLDPAPPELAFGKATAIERAHITPAACAKSLGYTAPVFAGVHDAEGELSLVVDGGRVPLADPSQADIWGKVTLHSAHATPGPLLRELDRLLNKPADLQLSKEVTVPVRLVQGRIHHGNVPVSVGQFAVTTSGSVGLDGSLALVVEMPVPPRWLDKNPLAPTLAKQPLKLPVGGTLAKPQIDEKALQQEMARFATKAAEDAVKKELEKNLKNLFPPKKWDPLESTCRHASLSIL